MEKVRKMAIGRSSSGISTVVFVAGLIVAILASSALSIVVAMQLATGPAGPQGPQGVQGPVGILNPGYDSAG